jgi:two-component system nitrate/nitrite response regulator NarL
LGNDETLGVIVFPDSLESRADVGRASTTGGCTSVILLGEVLCHREALARALRAYDDIALIGAVADVHAALVLAEENRADVLIVDSASDAVARALVSQPLTCKLLLVGATAESCQPLRQSDTALFFSASASLDDLHLALRFAQPRPIAPLSSADRPRRFAGNAGSLLTPREQEITRLAAGGCSNKEIADACGVSTSTVKNHLHRILNKLNVRRRAQLVHCGPASFEKSNRDATARSSARSSK